MLRLHVLNNLYDLSDEETATSSPKNREKERDPFVLCCLKGIRKVAQNPGYPDGYGKPLGNFAGSDLAGLYKIKFKRAGLRVVYALQRSEEIMTIVIISARADNLVYYEAERRRKKHDL